MNHLKRYAELVVDVTPHAGKLEEVEYLLNSLHEARLIVKHLEKKANTGSATLEQWLKKIDAYFGTIKMITEDDTRK